MPVFRVTAASFTGTNAPPVTAVTPTLEDKAPFTFRQLATTLASTVFEKTGAVGVGPSGMSKQTSCGTPFTVVVEHCGAAMARVGRSEERRVGKECRSRGSPDH